MVTSVCLLCLSANLLLIFTKCCNYFHQYYVMYTLQSPPKECIHFRMARNLEILEKLTSLGGSIFHFGHIKIKKIFLKILFNFATPQSPPIFPIRSQWAIFTFHLAPSVLSTRFDKSVYFLLGETVRSLCLCVIVVCVVSAFIFAHVLFQKHIIT